MNLVTLSRSSVGLTKFVLKCSTEYFFSSISEWNYFPLFLWDVLYIWLCYALCFRVDSEIGTGCQLRNLLLLFLQLSRSNCTLPFPGLFKIYVFAGFIFWLSNGIDGSTTMTLRFVFDKRTMSSHSPLLDIVLGNWYVGRYFPISTWLSDWIYKKNNLKKNL